MAGHKKYDFPARNRESEQKNFIRYTFGIPNYQFDLDFTQLIFWLLVKQFSGVTTHYYLA